MSDQPTYADVQARAKELGITDVVGKKRAFLEAAIAEAEAAAGATPLETAPASTTATCGLLLEDGTICDEPAGHDDGAHTPEGLAAAAAGEAPAAPTSEAVAHEITATKIGGVEAWVCGCGFRTMADEVTATAHAAAATA